MLLTRRIGLIFVVLAASLGGQIAYVPALAVATRRKPGVSARPGGSPWLDRPRRIRSLLAAAAARDAQTEAIVCLLVLNGLRVSEVCKADVEDLRREPGGGHSLVVRGKGGKEVEVALNQRTDRAVMHTVGARSQGPIFRRQDARRVRAGNPAPRLPFNR